MTATCPAHRLQLATCLDIGSFLPSCSPPFCSRSPGGALPCGHNEGFADGLAAYDAGDYAETVRIWRPLAERGDPVAQVALAGLHRSGEGVPRDLGAAARLYRAAAEQGNADAQLNLAQLYLAGTGVPRDRVEAYKWLTLAAAQGRGWAERRRAELAGELTMDELAEAERRRRAFSQD